MRRLCARSTGEAARLPPPVEGALALGGLLRAQGGVLDVGVRDAQERRRLAAVGVSHFISQWVFSTPKASTPSLCLGSALPHTIDWGEKADFSSRTIDWGRKERGWE